jgi:hypothetical protein
MKNRLLSIMTLLLVAALLTACAVKQEATVTPEPEPEAAMLLAYRMPGEGSLKYRLTVNQNHSMDMMGRSQNFSSEKVLEFSLLQQGAGEEGMPLTVMVDALQLKLDTPRGVHGREITELLGKSFNMTLSPSGEESDFVWTEEVAYEVEPAGRMNVSTDLEAFFPNLPEEELRIGLGWRIMEYLPDSAFNSGKKIKLEKTSILEGFETIDGIECVRIRTNMNGTLERVGEKMTRAPEMTARFDGSGVWYFDHAKGLLVRAEMTLRGNGEMQTGGGQGAPARMRQTMTITTQLLP